MKQQDDGEPHYYSPWLLQKYRSHFDNQKKAKATIERPPVISFHPDVEDFSARTTATLRKLHSLRITPSTPKGWPLAVDSPMTWTASDFEDESKFLYHLSDGEKKEIDSALKHFRSRSIPVYLKFFHVSYISFNHSSEYCECRCHARNLPASNSRAISSGRTRSFV